MAFSVSHMTLQASFMTCERSQNGLKMFLEAVNMGVDISEVFMNFKLPVVAELI